MAESAQGPREEVLHYDDHDSGYAAGEESTDFSSLNEQNPIKSVLDTDKPKTTGKDDELTVKTVKYSRVIETENFKFYGRFGSKKGFHHDKKAFVVSCYIMNKKSDTDANLLQLLEVVEIQDVRYVFIAAIYSHNNATNEKSTSGLLFKETDVVSLLQSQIVETDEASMPSVVIFPLDVVMTSVKGKNCDREFFEMNEDSPHSGILFNICSIHARSEALKLPQQIPISTNLAGSDEISLIENKSEPSAKSGDVAHGLLFGKPAREKKVPEKLTYDYNQIKTRRTKASKGDSAKKSSPGEMPSKAANGTDGPRRFNRTTPRRKDQSKARVKQLVQSAFPCSDSDESSLSTDGFSTPHHSIEKVACEPPSLYYADFLKRQDENMAKMQETMREQLSAQIKRAEEDRKEMEKKFKEELEKVRVEAERKQAEEKRIQEMVDARFKEQELKRKAEQEAAEREREQAEIRKKACMYDAQRETDLKEELERVQRDNYRYRRIYDSYDESSYRSHNHSRKMQYSRNRDTEWSEDRDYRRDRSPSPPPRHRHRSHRDRSSSPSPERRQPRHGSDRPTSPPRELPKSRQDTSGLQSNAPELSNINPSAMMMMMQMINMLQSNNGTKQ